MDYKTGKEIDQIIYMIEVNAGINGYSYKEIELSIEKLKTLCETTVSKLRDLLANTQ